MTDSERIFKLRDTIRMLIAGLPSHTPQCSLDSTNTPDGDYCDCRMGAMRALAQKALDETA
jgi:hypothetical protein